MTGILEFITEHNRKLAAAVSVLIVVLISLSVANTVLFVMEHMNPPSVIAPSQPGQPGRTARPAIKVSTLELFGKPNLTSDVIPIVDAPETSLNLELQGVFIAEDEARSTAIVGERNKAGLLYQIGERIPGNATLAAVHEDHVLLRRSGRMEKLLFSDSDFRGIAATQSQTNAARSSGGSTGLTGKQRANLQQVRDRLRNNTPGITGGSAQNSGANVSPELSAYREKLQNDPQGTLAEAGLEPVSVGSAEGYKIGSEAQSMIKQAGLQPGDVVLSVNGQPVGNATNDSALMNQVMASSRVRVEVQRGSRRFFLTVPVPK